jgi:hypothetical protein
MKKLLLGLVLVLGLVSAAPASALVTSYNEPVYTKATTENKNWFSWTRTPGVGSTVYFHCVAVYKNGILDESYDVALGTNCTPDLVGQSANTWYSPGNGVTPLTDGAFYETCVLDFRWNGAIWQSGPSACGATRIDRNKPGVTVYVNGTDTYTNNPNLTFRIDYADATSPPWPANYRCFNAGAACSNVVYDPSCSVPVANTFTFICSGNASSSPDGPLVFCALAADSAIPDVNGTNAFAGANSSNANLSDVGCGSIILDRVAPAVTAGSDATTVKSGQLVSFSAGATDGMSGLSGPFAWSFGDNTAGASGANVTHTYTQTGTFVASAVTHDGAGNTGTGTRTITVEPGGGTTTGGTTTGGTATGGGTLGGPTTASGIDKLPGVNATQAQSVGSLGVIAPKRFALKKGRRTLPVALTTDRPGKATLALLKGSRVVSRAAATFTLAGTFGLKMKLPKKLKAGKYKLKISFTPAGASKAVSRTLPLKITGRASASSAAAPVPLRLEGGAPYDPQPVQRRGIPRTDLG